MGLLSGRFYSLLNPLQSSLTEFTGKSSLCCDAHIVLSWDLAEGTIQLCLVDATIIVVIIDSVVISTIIITIIKK